MKQPKSINEIKEFLRTMADIKSGCKSFKPDTCAPCELCDVDLYELADDLMKAHLDGCQNSRRDERNRIINNLKKDDNKRISR